MNPKYIRTAAILLQSLYCLSIFVAGIVTDVTFFYTFLGPAIILTILAFTPRFFFDLIVVATMVMLLFFAIVYASVVALVNHDYLVASAATGVPLLCLATVIYTMERLKKEDNSYA